MGAMTCVGFLFVFSCEPQQAAPPPASTYCQIARPIYWAPKDTRATKEAIDSHNAAWKRTCRK